LKQNKPWFDEECLGISDQRKLAKTWWVRDPSQSNADNINNLRCEASSYFSNTITAYLKAKIEKLETNSKIKILETCIGVSMTSIRVNSLELIY
jgi:hypothetical protein